MTPETQQAGQEATTARTSNCLALACGSVVVCLALLAVGGYWAYKNVRRLAADAAYAATEKALDQAPLEDLERDEILLQVARVRDGFSNGDLGLDQMHRFFETVGEGPLLPLAAVMAVERMVLEPSGLSFDEKVEGQIHLERVARGLFERSITREQAMRVLEPLETDSRRAHRERADAKDSDRVSIHVSSEKWSLNIEEDPTDEQVLEMLRVARATADAAEIPVEPFEVDLVLEVRRAVDAAFQ
jgi:hypothetical protein